MDVLPDSDAVLAMIAKLHAQLAEGDPDADLSRDALRALLGPEAGRVPRTGATGHRQLRLRQSPRLVDAATLGLGLTPALRGIS